MKLLRSLWRGVAGRSARSASARSRADEAQRLVAEALGLRRLPFLLFAVVARSEALIERRGWRVLWSVGRVIEKAEEFQTIMLDGSSDPLLNPLFQHALAWADREGRYYAMVKEALEDALDPHFDDEDLREAVAALRRIGESLSCYEETFAALTSILQRVAGQMHDWSDDERVRIEAAQTRDLMLLHRMLAP